MIENEQALRDAAGPALNLDPSPGITRLELTSPAKLLIIDDKEPALRGYRCFLAITDKAREEMGEFFLQPHSTSIVWGGQKTLFIFMHHSGQFGLYYDLQTREVVDAPAGGGAYPTLFHCSQGPALYPHPRSNPRQFRSGKWRKETL